MECLRIYTHPEAADRDLRSSSNTYIFPTANRDHFKFSCVYLWLVPGLGLGVIRERKTAFIFRFV